MQTPAISGTSGVDAELKERLVSLVGEFTGESPSACRARVLRGVNHLRRKDRAFLDTDPRAVPTGTLGRLRRVLLPDACTSEQWAIEAAILGALPTLASFVGTQANPVMWVRPEMHQLGLHIQPEALIPLLFMILPRIADGEMCGCPGLRATPSRRSLILHIADLPGGAVMIHGTPQEDFPRIRQGVADLAGGDDATRLWAPGYGHGEAPTAAEHAARARRPGHPLMDMVSSAILRRPAVWPSAVWTRGGTYHALEPHDPPGVAAALRNKLCGIPFRIPSTTGRVVVIPESFVNLERWRCGKHRTARGN